jgi:hypothetical protein
MSEENSKDNERENDKTPSGFLSEGFVGSNPTPRTKNRALGWRILAK